MSLQPSLPLLKVLGGQAGGSRWVGVSDSGNLAVSGGRDRVLRVWDVGLEIVRSILEGHTGEVWGVALTPNGRWAISGSEDKTVQVWELETCGHLRPLHGHAGPVVGVAVCRDGSRAISGSWDRTVRVWDLRNHSVTKIFDEHSGKVFGVAISDDGQVAVSASADRTLRVWDLEDRILKATLRGHSRDVRGVGMSGDGRRAVSCSADKTLRVWDLNTCQLLATLEGHTAEINAVAISGDGRCAVSGGADRTVRFWDLDSGQCLGTSDELDEEVLGVTITSDSQRALTGSESGNILVWDLKSLSPSFGDAQRYSNAKVLLVGASCVGKTGLAYQLAEHRFVPSIATDAVWATQMRLPRTAAPAGIEREIWLWDFAGQSDYRLIQQLFMDEAALAVLVFDPQSDNPFEGLRQWDRDLQRAARRPFQKLLVAARIDRGGLTISRETIDSFVKERNFAGFIETSALLGTGCDILRAAIIQHIPWDDVPWTSSPRIFRLLKTEIVKLKDEGKVLLRLAELKLQLAVRLPEEHFTSEELRAVVGLLAGPGVVWQLEFGDFLLLQPEHINRYAAAVIRKVRAHADEIGCIAEEALLAGDLDYQDMKRLPQEEEQIVLRAMHQTFVGHGLCLREHADTGTLLIFPSFFKRERPELEGNPMVLVTYQLSGPLDEIYSTLVVRLHHTPAFERDRLWRFAADFKTPGGKRLGLKMTKKPEGGAELQVYFEEGISNDVQVTFIGYVHEHLRLKAQDVTRLRHYACSHCREPVENRRAIEVRLAKGFKDVFCGACGERVLLLDLLEEKFASGEFKRRARELEEQAKVAIDNESRELRLVGDTYVIASQAGQIYRQYTNSDHGIDGEIEFKDHEGRASGKRLYLQLKSGDSHLSKRKRDSAEIFTIKNKRHTDYWQSQAYPVMLVIRTSDGTIRWMDVSEALRRQSKEGKGQRPIVFKGETFTAASVREWRERVFSALR